MITLAEVVDYWAPESLPKDERPGLVDLLSRMIRLRPQDRESAQELLEHPWLQCSGHSHIPPPPPANISHPAPGSLPSPATNTPEVAPA